MTFHIIIQQERRTPVVKERRVYLGEYGYKEDANGCTYMVELEPDNFEIVVEEDRSRMAQSILDQLHSHSAAGLPENIDDPQFVMIAEWDGKSPYVICHKGDYSARTMGYAGWPEITAEQWVEQQNPNGEFL